MKNPKNCDPLEYQKYQIFEKSEMSQKGIYKPCHIINETISYPYKNPEYNEDDFSPVMEWLVDCSDDAGEQRTISLKRACMQYHKKYIPYLNKIGKKSLFSKEPEMSVWYYYENLVLTTINWVCSHLSFRPCISYNAHFI